MNACSRILAALAARMNRKKRSSPALAHHQPIDNNGPDAFERDVPHLLMVMVVSGRPEATHAIHRMDIPWYEAETPPVRHSCRAQTIGYTRCAGFVYRCACGALRGGGIDVWIDRNSRT